MTYSDETRQIVSVYVEHGHDAMPSIRGCLELLLALWLVMHTP